MAKATTALLNRLQEQRELLLQRKRRAIWMARHWYKLIVLFLAIYAGLPIAAPVLMYAGATGPASTLYTMYSPLCHQFAFRSVFLFGEQTFYPREAAKTDYGTFEEYASQSETFREIYTQRRRNAGNTDYEFNSADLLVWDDDLQMAARSFRGDEKMGYKIALCQRDILIYVSMVVVGIAYGFVKDRLRPAPFALYILLGIMPIGLDGFSQLLGYPPFDSLPLLENWEIRETKPLFRFLTGALFGIMNVWLAFPFINRSTLDNVLIAERDLAENAVQIEKIKTKLEQRKGDKSEDDTTN